MKSMIALSVTVFAFTFLSPTFGQETKVINISASQDQTPVSNEKGTEKLKALIVDGQNNHGNWPQTTEMMKQYLVETGLFDVDIARTKPKGTDENYQPEFSKYDVVVSNYNGAAWPEKTKKDFEDYMHDGGGLVVIHAADNAFGGWAEYNKMIGLGGWGGRNEKSGPYVYLNDKGKTIRDTAAGRGGGHGPQHEFSVVIRDSDHPITNGLPKEFLHSQDELYQQLRGPATEMKILATSFSSPKFRGTGRHEPMIMTVDYGKGRVFHTPMGHGNISQECVGFITVFKRGTEWAASGTVSIPVPEKFPSADKTMTVPFKKRESAGASK